MTPIILTPDQVKIFSQATDTIQLYDIDANLLGALPPAHESLGISDRSDTAQGAIRYGYTAEFIAELKRRAKEPGRRFTSAQVSCHLKALEEAWAREGPFDKKRAMEILEQSRSEGTPNGS